MTTSVSDSTTQTKLDTINSTLTSGNLTVVDSATRTKLDTVNSNLNTVNTNLGTLEDDVEATNTALASIETDIEATNTALASIETDIEATNTKLDTLATKLDTLETTLTTIETNTLKTLRQYRAEGKCFVCTNNWQATSTGYISLYLNNSSSSGKNYYIYNIELSFRDDNHDAAMDDIFIFADDCLTANFGTALNYTNLNTLVSVDGTNKTGYNPTRINSNEALITRYYAMVKSLGISRDFQEEFIRVPPGKQVFILMNNVTGSGYHTASIRWFEEDV